MDIRKFLKSCFVLFVAINLCGIGVALFVQSNLGSDSFTLLQEGMSVAFNMTIGEASRYFVIITVGLAFIISRKDIGWSTITYGMSVGYPIDFYNQLIVHWNLMDMHIFIRLLAILIGQFCFVVTFALLIKYRNGMGQVDAISYGLEKYTHIPYKYIRTGIDVLFIVIGWLLGGVVGIGTIFTMFTTGYGIDLCLKILDRKNQSLSKDMVLFTK